MENNILFNLLGAYIFSSGLSDRIELEKLPDLFNGKDGPGLTGNGDIPNGTPLGLVLASTILLLNNIIRPNIRIIRLIQTIINSIAVGGLNFAVGATNLD